MCVSIALKSYPAWDESESGVGRREKIISALVLKYIIMAASVLLKLLSAQMHNSRSWLSPRPDKLPSGLFKWPPLACAKHFGG
jgi:hypothetical protein